VCSSDLMGNHVSVWPTDPTSFQGVVNAATGEPADGSELARQIMPGLIYSLGYDFAIITQIDALGEPLGEGAESLLVAHYGVTDNNGLVYSRGESLPTAFVADSGVLKNPGPEQVRIRVLSGANNRIFTIDPGDGIVINNDVFAAGLPPKHEKQCLCYCASDVLPAEYNFRSDCPGCPEEDHIDLTNINCCCEGLETQACGDPNDGVEETLWDCEQWRAPRQLSAAGLRRAGPDIFLPVPVS